MNNCRTCYTIFVAFIFSFAASGCSSSYVKARSESHASAYPAIIERAKKDHDLIILHSGKNVYTVTALQLDRAKQNMEVQLNKLDSLHIVRITHPDSSQAGSAKSQASLREVHMHMKDSISYLLEEPYTIPLEKVARVDVVGKG